MSKTAILGRNGFIGSALNKRLPNAYNYPRPDLDYIFWFAAPSSQVLFNYAPDYCRQETLNGFVNILKFCKENEIKLIYPSTASYGNDYGYTKQQLEWIQTSSDYKNVLALRISAGYGIGEEHKGEYASVIYQFVKQMKQGERPVIYGDGSQTRDFIYIDDLIDNILLNKDITGVIEIGTGINTSFNEIIDVINTELKTNIKPVYVDKPKKYLQECISKGVPFKVSVKEGVKRLCV